MLTSRFTARDPKQKSTSDRSGRRTLSPGHISTSPRPSPSGYGKEHHGGDSRPLSALPVADQGQKKPAQFRLARLIASERAPTNMKLKAQAASRLNQLRDTNLRPRYR